MLLALDIGNSSISVGVFALDPGSLGVQKSVKTSSVSVKPNDLVHHFKISAKGLSADEYALLIYQFLQLKQIKPSEHSEYFRSFRSPEKAEPKQRDEVTHAVLASVVPEMTEVIAKAAEYLTGHPPFVVCAGVRTGFGIRIKNPEQLGADIVSNAAYAVEIAPPPIAILDVGTATTLTILDRNRDLLGTIIMPGLKISLKALSGSAAQLSDIALADTDVLIGRDSTESMQSGVVNGHIFMIDGFVRTIRERFAAQDQAEKLSLISTGGLANLIIPHTRNKFTNIESLTLFGEAKLFLLNERRLSL